MNNLIVFQIGEIGIEYFQVREFSPGIVHSDIEKPTPHQRTKVKVRHKHKVKEINCPILICLVRGQLNEWCSVHKTVYTQFENMVYQLLLVLALKEGTRRSSSCSSYFMTGCNVVLSYILALNLSIPSRLDFQLLRLSQHTAPPWSVAPPSRQYWKAYGYVCIRLFLLLQLRPISKKYVNTLHMLLYTVYY
jgi:hypothetical protein